MNLFRSSRDGLEVSTFEQRVYNQGATLSLFKTTGGKVCGGFTSISWQKADDFTAKNDSEAFLFNLTTKYPVKDPSGAIMHYKNGVNYGFCHLLFNVTSGTKFGTFKCDSENKKYFEIVNDANGINPLNGKKDKENVNYDELEIYKIIFL